MNEQPTTEHIEEPERQLLPGMEELAAQAETRPLGTVSDAADELAAENDRLKAEIRMRDTIYDIKTRLAQAGARSPGLLTDRAKERFQFSEEGTLENAEAVVEHLKTTYPEQFTPPSIDASAGRTQRPTLTKETLARMTPAEIQRLDWNEVRSALQEK